jgi:hypothetical protein
LTNNLLCRCYFFCTTTQLAENWKTHITCWVLCAVFGSLLLFLHETNLFIIYLSFDDKSFKIALICCVAEILIHSSGESTLSLRPRINTKVVNIETERKIIDCNYRQVFDIKNYFGRLFYLSISTTRCTTPFTWEMLLQPLSIHFTACSVLCSFSLFSSSFFCSDNNFFLMFYRPSEISYAYHYTLLCVSERKLALHIKKGNLRA